VLCKRTTVFAVQLQVNDRPPKIPRSGIAHREQGIPGNPLSLKLQYRRKFPKILRIYHLIFPHNAILDVDDVDKKYERRRGATLPAASILENSNKLHFDFQFLEFPHANRKLFSD